VTLHTLRFDPSGRTTLVQAGTSLLRAALDAGMPLASSCDGTGICRACRVRVVAGEKNLSSLSNVEQLARASGELEVDERYACQACALGPVTITTSYW
jgi:2Fe-2S ferredoxin